MNPLTRRSVRRRGEKGYVLALTAITLVPMLVVAGFAVDIGGGYAQATRMQRAADAAALAGVVWLPDFAKAQSVALDVADKNGWGVDGAAGISVSVTNPGARRLKVSIVAPGERYLTGLILDSHYNITRKSTAEYLRPIPMGSPIASLANDPESAAAPPQLWVNMSGPGSNKSNGDRFSSGRCVSSGSGYKSGCNGANDNLDLSPDGYFYIIRADAAGAQPLNVQVFDPAFTYTGDTCTVNGWTAAQQTTLINQYTAAGDTFAAQRYTWNNLAFCPGDQLINGLSNLRTTYIVRAPDNTPLDPSDNPAVCAISFDPYTGSIFNRLDRTKPANLLAQGTENMAFFQHFRRWTNVCKVTNPVAGDYIVQVTTTADQSAPLFSTTGSLSPSAGAGSLEQNDPSIATGGHNRLAIRAGYGSSVDGTGLGLFGAGRLPIYVNQNTSSASFYLARIGPEYAGATLALVFFDIADTAGSASMQVAPPLDSGLTTFSNCTFVRDGATPNVVPQAGCAITGLTSSSYDARNVTLKLVMPASYTCNDADRNGCWLKVNLTFSGAPADTTTWSASLLGDPVRLVE